MTPILSCHPGSLNAFALKLKPSDSLASLQERCARKLALPLDEAGDIDLKYLYCDVYYSLDDDDDFSIFTARHAHSHEVQLLLSSPSIPTSNPSIASLSSLPPSSSFSSPSDPHPLHHSDSASVYSTSTQSYLYGRAEPRDLRSGTSMHLVTSSELNNGNGAMSVKSGKSGRSGKSAKSNGAETATLGGKSKKAKSLAPTVPEHKIKFEEFHNQV
ncbi:hypothetical protein JCM21900_005117, partial [Sporobolomyces salmonicolor]